MQKRKVVKSLLAAVAALACLGLLAVIILPSLTRAREQAAPSGWSGGARSIDMLYSGGTGWGGVQVAGGSGSAAIEMASLSAGEEVWVIARPSDEGVSSPDQDSPGSGALIARMPAADGGEGTEVPIPLKHTDVRARIDGYIATVEVTQQYHNPFDTRIEASYVFPLPENAAVNEFVMTVGERRIHGVIREREEAEKAYEEARSQGFVASLLTQERANVFTQKIANIEPGKAIDIDVKYFHTLAYVDGWYEFVFPMVVAPRFNPPYMTEGIGAVAAGHYGASGQSTEVQYLKPSERSGHDISLAVDIEAGVAIEEATSRNHAVRKRAESPGKLSLTLSDLDSIPNKDFVLRYKVAGSTLKSALVTHKDAHGGFFTMILYPPETLASLKRAPLELVFVIDCSGSMAGQPVSQAKSAVKWALTHLGPGDSFQVISFNDGASALGAAPLEATAANVKRGLAYVNALEGSGGTMAVEGVKAALDFPHDPRRIRFVTFLTDGDIGNEGEVFAETAKRLGASRIFSFGIGSSPNRYMLDGLARVGKGAVAYLGLNDSASEAMGLFVDRIGHPAMTDITVDWGAMRASDVYPSQAADLFVGRPLILTGRFSGTGRTQIKLHGNVAGESREVALDVDLDAPSEAAGALPFVWARSRISALSLLALAGGMDADDAVKAIKEVATNYGLMSQYTAFVATDTSAPTKGDHGVSVAVPVPVPDGMRYDTTVVE